MTDGRLTKIIIGIVVVLLAISTFGWFESCQRYDDISSRMDSIKTEEDAAIERADSLRGEVKELTSEKDSLEKKYLTLKDSVQEVVAENDRLADSLRNASTDLDDDVVEAGDKFKLAMENVREDAPPRIQPLLDRVEATHRRQITILQKQVTFERERANTNRNTINKLQKQVTQLERLYLTTDSALQASKAESAELRSALKLARKRAEKWKKEANPSFILQIQRNLASHAAAAGVGALTMAVLLAQ